MSIILNHSKVIIDKILSLIEILVITFIMIALFAVVVTRDVNMLWPGHWPEAARYAIAILYLFILASSFIRKPKKQLNTRQTG